MGKQTCRCCGREKDMEAFPKRGVTNGKQRRRRECKECYRRIIADQRRQLRGGNYRPRGKPRMVAHQSTGMALFLRMRFS